MNETERETIDSALMDLAEEIRELRVSVSAMRAAEAEAVESGADDNPQLGLDEIERLRTELALRDERIESMSVEIDDLREQLSDVQRQLENEAEVAHNAVAEIEAAPVKFREELAREMMLAASTDPNDPAWDRAFEMAGSTLWPDVALFSGAPFPGVGKRKTTYPPAVQTSERKSKRKRKT